MSCCSSQDEFNTMRSRQNGRRFAVDTLKRIFLNENVRILIQISLKFVPKGPINNNPGLDQIMAWRRSGDKPLSEPMMVILLTQICVSRPQWVKDELRLDSPSSLRRLILFDRTVICLCVPVQNPSVFMMQLSWMKKRKSKPTWNGTTLLTASLLAKHDLSGLMY